jgi:hypothetical protein
MVFNGPWCYRSKMWGGIGSFVTGIDLSIRKVIENKLFETVLLDKIGKS